MNLFTQTNEVVEPDFQKEATIEVLGRKLKELTTLKILHQHGIKFSKSKGKMRKETPIPYLKSNRAIPSHLKFVILEKNVFPGNKLWGRIDFLVNHCEYQLIDERN